MGGREGYSINIKVVLLSFEMEVPILHYVVILFHGNISDQQIIKIWQCSTMFMIKYRGLIALWDLEHFEYQFSNKICVID